MITKEQAIEVAREYVLEKTKGSKNIFLVQSERTIEFELGWFFFYQNKEYIETGNFLKSAVGNSPIIINKKTGAVQATGTAYPIKKYIEDYLKSDVTKPKR